MISLSSLFANELRFDNRFFPLNEHTTPSMHNFAHSPYTPNSRHSYTADRLHYRVTDRQNEKTTKHTQDHLNLFSSLPVFHMVTYMVHRSTTFSTRCYINSYSTIIPIITLLFLLNSARKGQTLNGSDAPPLLMSTLRKLINRQILFLHFLFLCKLVIGKIVK